MDKFLELLSTFDLKTVIVLGIFIWILIKNLRSDMSEDFKKVHEHIENIRVDMNKMSTRISRIEGTVYGKEIYEKVKE